MFQVFCGCMTDSLKRFDVPKIALPLILSNLTVPLLALTDAIVVGHLHSAYYLAAVGFGSSVFAFIYWCFGFLRQGTTSFIAQAFGRQDLKSCVAFFERGIFMALVIASFLLLLQKPIADLLHFMLHKRIALFAYTAQYFYVRIWAAPAALMNYVFNAWFLGTKRTRYCLYLMLVVNGLAILFDIVFVYDLHMNVKGVALADVLGQWCGIAYACYVLWTQKHMQGYITKAIFQWQQFQKLLALNRDIFIRTASLMLCFLFFDYQGAMLGKDILAANTVLINIMMFMAYGQDGFNNAAEILVASSLGAKNIHYFWQSIRATCFWSVVVGMISVIVFLLFGHAIIRMITTIPIVIHLAQHYMPWVVISPLITTWCFWLDGVFIGASWGGALRNGMLSAVATYFSVWYLGLGYGNEGLWVAIMSLFAARSVMLLGLFWFKTRPLQMQKRDEVIS